MSADKMPCNIDSSETMVARAYQVEMYEASLTENVIVVVKTLVRECSYFVINN